MSDMVQVELSRRELTLIRVALLMRLNELKAAGVEMQDSYQQSRALLTGKLWIASVELREITATLDAIAERKMQAKG